MASDETNNEQSPIDKIRALLATSKPSGWMEDAKWRQDNRYWLNKSSNVALTILTTIRKQEIPKEDFIKHMAENTTMTETELENLLKGRHDFTLSQIAVAEKYLNVKLVKTKIDK